ncbi:hypothetical protein PHPALM_29193 [Phytophthora palmivora]|uniref:Uncharacterized protein n=1 Tax=Phytophthora palmivora TaxID=4796 RepID=A0A2P4X879_9STRA|nr:hypothetical protein PHPALM_29193 [Phytophthora palmivora]
MLRQRVVMQHPHQESLLVDHAGVDPVASCLEEEFQVWLHLGIPVELVGEVRVVVRENQEEVLGVEFPAYQEAYLVDRAVASQVEHQAASVVVFQAQHQAASVVVTLVAYLEHHEVALHLEEPFLVPFLVPFLAVYLSEAFLGVVRVPLLEVGQVASQHHENLEVERLEVDLGEDHLKGTMFEPS